METLFSKENFSNTYITPFSFLLLQSDPDIVVNYDYIIVDTFTIIIIIAIAVFVNIARIFVGNSENLHYYYYLDLHFGLQYFNFFKLVFYYYYYYLKYLIKKSFFIVEIAILINQSY